MRTRIAAGIAVLTAVAVSLAGSSFHPAGAQDKSKVVPPKHLYGHDVLVRPGGQGEWTKALKVGVEFFHDEADKAIVAISDPGYIAVTRAPVGALGKAELPKWLTAHDLSCRRAGEAEFTKSTKKYGVELFQDKASNSLLYVCETGALVLTQVPGALVTDKGPKWHHAMEPKVRPLDQNAFDNAKKFGMEVFKDENTGGLLYITEPGAIAPAAAPGAPPEAKQIKAPKTMYGLVLRVRGATETEFTDKTKKVAVEVFEDPNANVLFYITEAGGIATAPNKNKIPEDARGVTWRSGFALGARKAGEKEFDKAKKYGVEVFEDNRTGNLIFIAETGSIAVLPK